MAATVKSGRSGRSIGGDGGIHGASAAASSNKSVLALTNVYNSMWGTFSLMQKRSTTVRYTAMKRQMYIVSMTSTPYRCPDVAVLTYMCCDECICPVTVDLSCVAGRGNPCDCEAPTSAQLLQRMMGKRLCKRLCRYPQHLGPSCLGWSSRDCR
jgi:hypothetical protein